MSERRAYSRLGSRSVIVSLVLLAIVAVASRAAAQPSLLLDLFPTSDLAASSEPADFAAFAGEIYFSATTTEAGREIWRSDGTALGTVRVSDLFPGLDASSFRPLGVANGHLIFQASEGSDGNGLWATDGTSEPVRLRAGTGVYGEFCQSPLVIADVFYCTLIQYPQYAVVRSDGTVGGTMLITPTTRSLYSLLGEFQGSLYYLATEIGGRRRALQE